MDSSKCTGNREIIMLVYFGFHDVLGPLLQRLSYTQVACFYTTKERIERNSTMMVL